MRKRNKNPQVGSSFDSWLEEAGLKEEVTVAAIKSVITHQIVAEMKKKRLTKKRMAELMSTSRAQLDRILDPESGNATIESLQRAARILGLELKMELGATESTRVQAPSTELTGGSGFTYEDTVVAYYLAALLREERAAGQDGVVISVAVQQAGHDQPMDDIIVEFKDAAEPRILGLQVKRQLRVSAANEDFSSIMAASRATRALSSFQPTRDAYGFVVEHVAVGPMRTIGRLIDWARASPTGEDYERRFFEGGAAASAERELRSELQPLTGATTVDAEADFYRHFVALHVDGLSEGGLLRAEIVNRLQELVAENEDGQDILLFDRLCRIVRDGAGQARKWTRATLLGQLRGVVRLRIAPSYARDLDTLRAFSSEGLTDVLETIDDFHVARPALQGNIAERLAENRLVNISGLPGCGKSAVLKRFATDAAAKGPILFLKSDRLIGNGWSTFASTLGLQHTAAELLAEISAAGTPIVFIDGIDRIRPDQKGIISDLLRVIETDPGLAHWRALASSRDQGLEAYRAWFPPSFYRGSGIGNVSVNPFSDDEAEVLAEQKPNLRSLLFGSPAVREIARRPFFAAVLARSLANTDASPQTEIDLIAAWWARAGHDALPEAVPLRQRALLDLAETGVGNLGKSISTRALKDATFTQIASLKADLIVREQDHNASYSFTHDIFFEWTFFRLLIELGPEWHRALIAAGEPPLLGRVIALLAQSRLTTAGQWTAGYRALEAQPLRPQWRREWLTAPPFTPSFISAQAEFHAIVSDQDFVLLQKLLVWFQAQHTVPSPIVLGSINNAVEGVDNIRIADLLGWPSDFQSWGRLLDWLLPLAPTLPLRLLPSLLELFDVWQNALADLPNARSAAIVDLCQKWLIELEVSEYSERPFERDGKWRELGSKALSSVAGSLRMAILRAARSYPEPARALFERAVTNERMRRAAYSDLMGFTPIMAVVAPEAVVAVAEAELMEELPQEKFDRQRQEERDRRAWLKELRAIPETQRTPQQRQALASPPFFPIGADRFDLDDIGIDRHHNYYFPPSALHEPFASLFTKAPEHALRLVRDLSNQAVRGWKQIHDLNRGQMGTPLPVSIAFPRGEQQFWGDWHVYSWSQGQLAPQPLECAYLALSYWAFKEIENGRSASEVISRIIEGNDCYATLGLALVLALEVLEVSDVTLPIASCQRLWHHDMARLVHEPTKNIDLLGYGFLSRLTGTKQQAKEYLDQRKCRSRDVRQLAMCFALSGNETLREAFRAALERFPADLPYEFEEQRSNPGATEHFMENAERWSGLGDRRNYQQSPVSDDAVMITYEPPTPLTPEQEHRLAETTTYLQEQNALGWATKSLSENKPTGGWTLVDAIAFAKARDTDTLFDVRRDVGGHAVQSAVSAIAACIIRFDAAASSDRTWAWDIMGRVGRMAEPERFSGSRIPWHPSLHLIVTLVHDRRSASPRTDSAERLLELTAHPLDDVSQLAFQGLFRDNDEHVRWVSAQLAVDWSLYRRPVFAPGQGRDDSADRTWRAESLSRALARLAGDAETPLSDLPPAWVKTSRRGWEAESDQEGIWGDPDPMFNGQFAAKIFSQFPIEAWCQLDTYRPMVQTALIQWVTWTAERLRPSWRDAKDRRDRETYLHEWSRALGDLLARAAPFFEADWVRQHFLAPFLTNDDNLLRVLAEFADKTVIRHIVDASTVPANTLTLLDDCAERVLSDPMFNPKSYRAGEVHGYDMPTLVSALLFVGVEHAPGAARFANGDWSELSLVMPLVTKLVSAVGWSSFVMQKFLTLCERAGASYPLYDFCLQAKAVLASLANAKASWAGTTLPARTAGVVQRLADGNYPLRLEQAQQLLHVLDALVDLGDRRSAALEQTEAFRSVQLAS
ncbi:AAA family ATPase [Bradyrhizobium sp. Cp5.3]|uniref:AAA family ATPase n=1 Tax=Bradyrhizobium sp. Cp5.3 TaxID=443598 RepID=UPI0003FD1818|nr:AAA family ATPase [Bradyrhizobium sp. Cp5.3]